MKMNFKSLSTLLAVVASVGCAAAANAATVYSAEKPTLEIGSPGSFSKTFNAAGGAALLTFNLVGYGSIDGAGGYYTDTFTLLLNNTAIWRGEYGMGGYTSNQTDFIPAGSTINPVNNGLWQGGNIAASIPLNLVSGSNTLTFSYSGVNEGLGNEGWGTNGILVSGAVPESSTWAMMLVGFGVIGFAARHRQNVNVAYA